MTVSVRTAFFAQLRELGLTTVFGNPGSTEEPMLSDFPDDFRYVLALQEASVVAMADGYAQATGMPALVNLHTAAGVGHAMTSIMTAAQNHTPLIITAGQQPRTMLLLEPYLTNVDATALPEPWVKWSYETQRAQDAPAAMLRAYATAVQPPQGPVFLSLPMDDWQHEADLLPGPRSTSTRTGPDPVRLAELARALRTATSPAFVIGGGVDRAGGWDDAVALAERLSPAVYSAPANERPGFPEDHPLFQGQLPFAIGPLSEQLEGHDLVVVFGAPVFRYYPYVPGRYQPEGTILWHISDDPSQTARAPVGHALLCDPGLALSGLLDQLDDVQPADPPAARPPRQPPELSDPLEADHLFAILGENREPHTVLVEESLSNRARLYDRWPATEPNSVFSFASGALGWGLPASVGIAMAERDTGRDRPVIAVIGDGAVQYCIQAIWTAVQQRLRLLVVVPDNQQYTILKSFAEEEDNPGLPGLDLPGIDITKIAEGYGADAVRARTADEVTRAIRDWKETGRVAVLVVPIDRGTPELL